MTNRTHPKSGVTPKACPEKGAVLQLPAWQAAVALVSHLEMLRGGQL